MRNSQSGFAHIQVLVVAILVIGAIGAVGWRVATSNRASNVKQAARSSQNALPAELTGVKTID